MGHEIWDFDWTPLTLMAIIHIVGLTLSIRSRKNTAGHILGIVASSLGWIPFVGWILHVFTAIHLSDPSTEAH